jgi:hypothetical protein
LGKQIRQADNREKMGKGQRRCRRKEDREETENKLGKKQIDGNRGRK